ncbi:MAG: HxsD-like protein [Candidatus Woesearchaeota archaeon]
MKKVTIKDKAAVLQFNKKIYEEKMIKQAAEDYGEICSVEFTDTGIVLKPKEEGQLKLVGYEFYNYVLGLMKNQ